MPNNDTPISSFQDATEINSADKLTGLQNNVNRNFSFSTILSWFVQTVAAAFVPVSRKVNNKALSADITLDASDVGAQASITASGILKGDGAGGVSAAVAGTDYGTYSKPSGGIPSSDMTSAVQTSLGKANSAYQKPSGGIPASDLANGVIPSVPSPSDSTPQALGTAAAGSSGNYSRADHVHQKPSAADIGAYVKPSGGIPSSDMASGVQTSLGKADTAYQKPSAGIPSSDMASAVQTSLGLADSAYQLPSGGIPASDLASGVIPTVPSISASTPNMDGMGAAGSTGEVSDAGHTHPSDTTKANQSQLAYVESGSTASRAYAVGEYFCWGGLLYRVTTAISSGGTFTPGTNCETMSVGAELTTLDGKMYQVQYSGNATYSYTLPAGRWFLIYANRANKSGTGLYAAHITGASGYLTTIFETSGFSNLMVLTLSGRTLSVQVKSTYATLNILNFGGV